MDTITTPIYALPNEILCEIYNFVPKKTLLDVALVSRRLSYAIPSYLLDHYRKYSHCMKEISEIKYDIIDMEITDDDIVFSSENVVEVTNLFHSMSNPIWKTKYSLRTIKEKRTAFLHRRHINRAIVGGFITTSIVDNLIIYANYESKNSELIEGYDSETTIFGDLGLYYVVYNHYNFEIRVKN